MMAPNPFRGATEISYVLHRAGRVLVDIIDVRGRRVSRLEEEERLAGTHRVSWNGMDDRGERVSAGMYFARVAFGGTMRAIPLVLME